MKQKTNEILEKGKEIYGEESDFLIISHVDGQCGAVTHGKTDAIAESYFAAMHIPGNELAPVLYRILKLNVENILRNQSAYTVDLINTITKALSTDE